MSRKIALAENVWLVLLFRSPLLEMVCLVVQSYTQRVWDVVFEKVDFLHFEHVTHMQRGASKVCSVSEASSLLLLS